MTQLVSSDSAHVVQLSLDIPQQRLMEEIVSPDNVLRAWKRIKANRGAPGIDGITIKAFPASSEEHWPRIRRQLLDGTYRPQPVRRKAIPKPDGTMRQLGIPTVMDRVLQQAVHQILTPLFDPEFSESSFGYRPRRSAHGAVKQVQKHIRSGCNRVVKVDLAKFFDSAHHDVLMSRVARKVTDRRVLRLIGRYLRADVMVDGVLQPVEIGTPQGGPLSPLLANILLDDLDKELERRQLRFTRYADDFVIMVRSDWAGHRVKTSVTYWLRRYLRLAVNESKSEVLRKEHCVFLGFSFDGAKAVLPSQVLHRFRQRVRELTGRSRGISWGRRRRELNAYLRGWMSYFGLCQAKGLWRPWDEWIRRRLRACLLKQWKRRATRVRRLLSLGAPRHLAVKAGTTHKGPWRASQLPGTCMGLPTRWFDAQGLVRLSSQWDRLAPLRRTA